MLDELWLGDSLVLMRDKIPNNSIDLIVTDPPYRMTKRGKSCRPNWMPSQMGDNVFEGEIPDTLTWMSECYRVLKEQTHFYVFCNTNELQNYLNCAEKSGFKFHNLISMIKDTGMPNRWYYKQTELILFFRKGRAKRINDVTSRDNVKVIMPKAKDGKLHITQKPLDFVTKLVTNSSEPGEIVLDPFAGSGTTLLAASSTNRKYIGIEKEQKYFDIALKRLS